MQTACRDVALVQQKIVLPQLGARQMKFWRSDFGLQAKFRVTEVAFALTVSVQRRLQGRVLLSLLYSHLSFGHCGLLAFFREEYIITS